MARKPAQIGTFGTHLQNFTRSVDIVDDQTLSETCSLIYEYLHSEWDAATFEVVLNSWVDNVPGLRTSWSSANRGLTTTIKGADNKYTSQLVVSFDTGSPLWIVDPEREPLRTVESYVDQWSRFADLPPYRPPTNQNLFTSIIIPMRRPNNRILGVIALESATNLNIAEYDSGELELRADELGVLIDLADLNHVQTQGARDAIGNLRKIRGTVVFPQLAKPQLFLAFSAAADQEVVGVLVEVLEEFENQLRVVQWDQIEDSGTSRRSSLRRSQRRGSAFVTSRSHRRMLADLRTTRTSLSKPVCCTHWPSCPPRSGRAGSRFARRNRSLRLSTSLESASRWCPEGPAIVSTRRDFARGCEHGSRIC